MENSQKTIYLHIGMPKTGSTSVQMFLFHNKEKLKETEGLLYPIAKNPDINYNENSFNIRRAVLKEYPLGIDCYNKYIEETFIPQIEESGCENIVFSEELLFSKDTDFYDIFLQHGYNVKIVAYIRKPVEYITSAWQENVKSIDPIIYKFDCTIFQFLDKFNIGYDCILKHIEKLGRDNVIVRPFEKEQLKNKNLIEDFLNIFSIENFPNASDYEKMNAYQYNRHFLEYMGILKCFDLSYEELLKNLHETIIEEASEQHKIQFADCNLESVWSLLVNYVPENPKVIDTIDYKKIVEVTKKWEPVINNIAKIYGREKMFNNIMPKNASEENNKELKEIIFNPKQIDIIRKLIKSKNK